MAVVEAGHPAFGKRTLVLFFETPFPIRQGPLDGHTVFGSAQRLDSLDTMPVAAGKEEFHLLAQRMLAVVEFASEPIREESCGLGMRIGALEADVEAIVAAVDPAKGLVHAVGGDEDAEALGTDGPLDGTLPAAFGGFHLDHLGDEGQVFARQAEFVGESFAKVLESRGNVRVWAGFGNADFPGEPLPGFAEGVQLGGEIYGSLPGGGVGGLGGGADFGEALAILSEGSFSGFGSANTLMGPDPTSNESEVVVTVPGNRPWTESYFSM